MSGAIGLLTVLGVRIHWVADLEERALYIEDRRLLLLDTELSDSQADDVAIQLVESL